MCCLGLLLNRPGSLLHYTFIWSCQRITVCVVTYGCFSASTSKSGTLQHSLCANCLANTHVGSQSIPGKDMCLEMKLCQLLLCVITQKVPRYPSSAVPALIMNVIQKAELEKRHGKHKLTNFEYICFRGIFCSFLTSHKRSPSTDTLETFGLRSKG